jgi:hypothetical protein
MKAVELGAGDSKQTIGSVARQSPAPRLWASQLELPLSEYARPAAIS